MEGSDMFGSETDVWDWLRIQGDSLDIIIENIKKLIDEFWSQYQSIYDKLNIHFGLTGDEKM